MLGRHDSLLKYNVACDDHLLGVVEEELVGVVVLTCWAEICGCMGLAAQLGVLVTVVEGESSAAKHTYMHECGWLAEPVLEQCLHGCGIVCVVEHVDGHVEGLTPELLLDTGLSEVGSNHGELHAVEPLSDSIEFRHVQ